MLSDIFVQVRVDVSARNHGMVKAALTENRKSLNELLLEPLREEQYYEVSLFATFCLEQPLHSTDACKKQINFGMSNILFFFSDTGTILDNVIGEEPNGSDDGIHVNCCVPHAKANGEHG